MFSAVGLCASESVGRWKPQVAGAARNPRQHTGGAVGPHRSVSSHTCSGPSLRGRPAAGG